MSWLQNPLQARADNNPSPGPNILHDPRRTSAHQCWNYWMSHVQISNVVWTGCFSDVFSKLLRHGAISAELYVYSIVFVMKVPVSSAHNIVCPHNIVMDMNNVMWWEGCIFN